MNKYELFSKRYGSGESLEQLLSGESLHLPHNHGKLMEFVKNNNTTLTEFMTKLPNVKFDNQGRPMVKKEHYEETAKLVEEFMLDDRKMRSNT
jgi:hypothetical protein